MPFPLKFSPLGLGCVTFGREIDATAAFKIMDHAWAQGLTFFDTASAYGGGASEEIVGGWLARRLINDRSCVATKVLPPYTAAAIEKSVENSLRRLDLEVLPVLFLHRWDETLLKDEALLALDGLVARGKVRHLGVSNFSAEQLRAAVERQKAIGLSCFGVLQNNHNFAVREADPALRELCAAERIAIVTFSPLGAGFLTGKHTAGVEAGSRFDLIPGHQQIYFHEASLARLRELQLQAQRVGKTSTELALIWALHQPGIASVLIGARSVAHLDQALAAARADPQLLGALRPEGL